MGEEWKNRVANKHGPAHSDGRGLERELDGFPISGDPDYHSGFAEGEAAGGPSSAAREPATTLTKHQQQLREMLLTASEDEAVQALESGSYSFEDFFEVALDSLERSNAAAERMLTDSAEYRRQFEWRSQQIDTAQRETDRKLAELLGDGR